MRVAAFCRSVIVTLESGDKPVARIRSAVAYRLEPCTRTRTKWYCSGAASQAMEIRRKKKNSNLQLRIGLASYPAKRILLFQASVKKPKRASFWVFASGQKADS